MIIRPHLQGASSLPSPSWMLTFADLLGIVLAMFVLIYATSDRQADDLNEAVIALTSSIVPRDNVIRALAVADVTSAAGYQTALLKKHVTAMPYWTVDTSLDTEISMQLHGQSLTNVLGEGAWLDIVERFESDVSLRVYVADEASRLAALQGAQKIAQLRASRGLRLPWTISVEPALSASSVRADIKIPLGTNDEILRFSDLNLVRGKAL